MPAGEEHSRLLTRQLLHVRLDVAHVMLVQNMLEHSQTKVSLALIYVMHSFDDMIQLMQALTIVSC